MVGDRNSGQKSCVFTLSNQANDCSDKLQNNPTVCDFCKDNGHYKLVKCSN